MTTTVLVVDDEPAIRRLVSSILARGGYGTAEAGDARGALATSDRRLDAAIVDLGLPDRDGLELVATFAARGLPTLVLSARLDVADRIAALDLGADDYLTKPFDGDELLARLRVILRGIHAPVDEPLSFGGVLIEEPFHRASIDGAPVPLTPREYALLKALVAAGGRVLTHRTLLEQVWGPAHLDDSDYLRVAIRALRKKCEVDPSRPERIINLPGVGYRLAEHRPCDSPQQP